MRWYWNVCPSTAGRGVAGCVEGFEQVPGAVIIYQILEIHTWRGRLPWQTDMTQTDRKVPCLSQENQQLIVLYWVLACAYGATVQYSQRNMIETGTQTTATIILPVVRKKQWMKKTMDPYCQLVKEEEEEEERSEQEADSWQMIKKWALISSQMAWSERWGLGSSLVVGDMGFNVFIKA